MKNNWIIKTVMAFLALPLFCSANMGPQGFHEYKQRIFVETGCFGGDGIQKALDAGFNVIYSMDISPAFVRDTRHRFRHNPNVHVYLKDSGTQLCEVIANIYEPVTFWLDAHNGFPDPNAIDVKNTPLIEELEQIKQHPIKTHTILIDDMHCCDTLLFDYLSLNDIIQKVLEINPNYTITFVPGGDDGEYPVNVLVAYIAD